MNAMTAKALSLAVAVALWTAISHLAELPLLLWPVIIGLACFLAAGGGLEGLKKTLLAVVAGVVWAMVYVAVSRVLGHKPIVDALLLGAVVFGMVFQARVALLGFTAGTIAGAAVSLGAMGVRAVTLEGGIRVVAALAIGAGLGYGAEFLAGKIKTK